MASKNAQDGISLIQTAEGALNETHAILQRMRELAVQSANDTNVEIDRGEIQKEIDQLASEITRIADDTEFNTQNLLGGKFSAKFHVGANQGQNVDLSIKAMDAGALKVAGAEGASFEVTATIETDNIAEGSYDVVKLDEGTKVKQGESEIEVKYALVDEEGQVQAVSVDGKTYNKLEVATELSKVSEATIKLDNTTDNTTPVVAVKFEDAVINGKVEVEGNTATATATVKTDLANDTYTIVGTEHGGVSSGYGLVNSKGDLVALSADGKVWNSYADSEKIVLTLGEALTEGTITVGTEGGINVSTQKSADSAITVINKAIEDVSAERSKLGAMQNRLEHTIKNLDNTAENLQAAESRIRDVDMAKEMMEFTKQSILQQAATAMLAQANQMPSTVLQLLR